MKIKKYEASTEQEAILKVKEDLGKDALILNIKKIQPKGVFKIFTKPRVEVTVAYEEKKEEIKKSFTANSTNDESIKNEIFVDNIEKKIDNLETLLYKMSSKLLSYEDIVKQKSNEKYNNTIINIIYDNLIANEVMPEIAVKLLENLDEIIEKDKENLNLAVGIVYNRIIEIIGNIQPIIINKDEKPSFIVMMGPTGVGKTTTIAKLSSHFILKEHCDVGLITADTYRIAAIEQLKVYSDILGIETEVIYSETEIEDIFKKLSYKDIVFIDTAGRSHKNNEQIDELNLLLQKTKNCGKYLVLSMTTKCKDLISIVDTYSKITDYNIIFTKSDETITKGIILNICYLTGKTLSYITNGQNVPEDIEIIKPEEIAKALLGSIEE